ncbi:uncharacterized protein BX664DRAFT_329274 [Halteromyces radiatus]|uniref:uncharacterized protein n=1 Tax=Halteromyces radiatus TaxID=101107 RepID=UPI0022200E30|nr:uncharacterized protein BX664DRAFT_329274 [Halteromyces radiatus]KAI8093241.1 hypothetical protein BX664DRAFT_329274 [Halteromyces radiatus]
MKEAPWSDQDTLRLPNKEERLAKEILQFEKYISPTKEELQGRLATEKMIERLVKAIYPDVKIECFGSHVTGLLLPSSDIDIVIHCDSSIGTEKSVINRIKRVLLKQGVFSFDEIVHIPFAKVPVLTIDSLRYTVAIDITVNNIAPSSNRTSLWIKQYPELKPLYLVLKHALQSVQHPRENFMPMSSKSNGLASYALVCLIVNFLSVEAEKLGCIKSSPTYYANLLVEFLDFYANFNFATTGIQFDSTNPYFEKGYLPPLAIQDPDVEGSNIGRSCSMIAEVQECFSFLLDTLLENKKDGPPNSILERIIPVSQQLPLDGTQRLEGRNYKVQPLPMLCSASLEKAQSEKRIRNMQQRQKRRQLRSLKRQKRNNDNDQARDSYNDNDDYDCDERNNKKRKRLPEWDNYVGDTSFVPLGKTKTKQKDGDKYSKKLKGRHIYF